MTGACLHCGCHSESERWCSERCRDAWVETGLEIGMRVQPRRIRFEWTVGVLEKVKLESGVSMPYGVRIDGPYVGLRGDLGWYALDELQPAKQPR